MNLKDYRTLFAVCSLVLSVFAITPTLNMFVPFYVKEPFSELSILGPAHTARDYPFNVHMNSEERLFVTVSNHMGESAYYMVYVKLRNQTQSFPNSSTPSPLGSLYEFRIFLLDGEEWEGLVRFKLPGVLSSADTVWVNGIVINNVVFEADYVSKWDSEYEGFYFQLFFELWLYDLTSRSFRYHDRSVGVWLNVTI